MSWAEAAEVVKNRLGLVANTPQSATMIRDVLLTVNQAMWHVMGEDQLVDRFVLRILPCGTFWAPPGYGSLDAINIQGAPSPVRDRFFEFHQNGPGSIGLWRKPQTVKLGTFASMIDPSSADYFSIGVQAEFPEQDAKVVVEGIDRAGNAVDSFIQSSDGPKKHAGELFRPNANMVISSKILWKNISRVRKNGTNGPVSIWAFPEGDQDRGVCVAVMPARSEGNTLYTKYKLGACQECCGWPYVEARMRIEHPAGPSEHVWVASVRALTFVAEAAHMCLKTGGNAVQKEANLRQAAEIAAEDFRRAEPGQQGRPEVDTNIQPENFYVPV
jgi:hypothetical protein